MSRIGFVVLLFVAVCVGAAGAQVFAPQKPDDPPPAPKVAPGRVPTAKWHYRLVRLVNESELADKANKEAEKGWEVDHIVPADPAGNQFTILMRRPADLKE